MEYNAFKEHQKQYNKVYYEKNKEKILLERKLKQEDPEWKEKRKAYRKKYYALNKK